MFGHSIETIFLNQIEMILEKGERHRDREKEIIIERDESFIQRVTERDLLVERVIVIEREKYKKTESQ